VFACGSSFQPWNTATIFPDYQLTIESHARAQEVAKNGEAPDSTR
jgi:hypothetical protein